MLRLFNFLLFLIILNQLLFIANTVLADETQMNSVNTPVDSKITATIIDANEDSNISVKLISDKMDINLQEVTSKIEEVSKNYSRLSKNLDDLSKKQSDIEMNMGNQFELFDNKLQLLNEAYGSLMKDVSSFTNNMNNEIKSLNEMLLLLRKDYKSLTTNLNTLSKNTNNEIISIKRSVLIKFLAIGISVAFIVIISIIGIVFIQKKFKKIDVLKESINLDIKLSEILEKQLLLMKNTPTQKGSDGSDITSNHLLAIKVGSEIFRMHKRIEIMDVNTKGLTALRNALNRMENEFNKQGYTIKNLADQPYQDEMTVRVVNSIKRDDLKLGDKLITRMITPQVYYNGIVISHGEVEIAVSNAES